MTRIPRQLIACLVIAHGCERAADDDAPRIVASTPGDSAGWYAASVPTLGLRLQYPISHVRAVLDRSTRECSTIPLLPGVPWDSTGGDTLIVATAPSSFDSIAVAMGFDVRTDGYAARTDTLHGSAWTSVDSLRVGPWRVLTALAETKIYFDDMTYEPAPGDSKDARMSADDVWQERFVAVAPGSVGCAIVLAWRGHIVRRSKESYDAGKWPPTLMQAFLARATLASKPRGAGQRQ